MADATLETLFHDTLRDVLYAERKAIQILKKQARAAQDERLRDAFVQHREETEGQVERLNRIFELLGKRARGKVCPAMDGLAEEGEEIIEEMKDSPALDAGLVGAAQAVEHYEIARYGTLAAWARQLGMAEAEGLLRETLAEEEAADQLLSRLAEEAVNAAADRPTA
jgi:ferritin-like metal-binding protein YciE